MPSGTSSRPLHLPSELAVQAAALPHSWLIQGSNLYYAGAHAPALGIFLVWLFLRHRDQYPPWRNVIAILTFVCLAIQLIPVAPPRLLPELGFVDTAHLYGQSVYGAVVGTGSFDQLSAMPSVHVGWAVAIGVAVVLVSTSRWRWLVLAHPIATAYVVVVTANHWWLDGIVAVAILVAGMAIVHRAHRLGRRPPARRPRRSPRHPRTGGGTRGGLAVAATLPRHGRSTRREGRARSSGASRGIGKAIAAEYAASGAKVMLTSRKQEALEDAAADIGGDTAVMAANVGDVDAAEAVVLATLERFGAPRHPRQQRRHQPVLRPGDGHRPEPVTTRPSR